MISRILVSNDFSLRERKIEGIFAELGVSEGHPDTLYIKEEKVGVKEAKSIREFLSIKPYSAAGRVVAVLHAHKLTLDAQNSLLKTLEEPPQEASLILGVNNEGELIQTILSRCEIVILNEVKDMNPRLSPEEIRLYSSPLAQNDNKSAQDDRQEEIERLVNSSIDERFEVVEKVEDKKELLKGLLIYYRKKLPENSEYVSKLIQAEEWAKHQGNIRAILEYLMLEMPG